jgi:Fe-S-cluster-containing hydrogenase component 2
MAKKLLIDLDRLRDNMPGESSDSLRPEGVLSEYPNSNGRKTIRELAVFRYTCRRCEDAPCICACPADALDKDDGGMIRRSTNLCIACKSCVVICPFGTMMSDFFEHHRTPENYFDLSEPDEIQKFIDRNAEGVVSWVDMEEDPENNIYQLNDMVLVKEADWESIKGK